jgi:hypothetical protein
MKTVDVFKIVDDDVKIAVDSFTVVIVVKDEGVTI